MASNDPEFAQKAAHIIALYMKPPRHTAVFCVDEKIAIQALDRLDPVLPLSPCPSGWRWRWASGGAIGDGRCPRRSLHHS